jgi:LPXTG-motif cell wall-anchored protein
MIDKVVEMTKNDIGGNEVEGAKIQVLDKEGNIVDEWTSEKNSHKINGLEEGQTYTLHEEVAPDGYVKATDIQFTVTADKETEHITLIDKIVKVTKSDLTNGEELEGAELEITDEEGNIIDSWTSTKESHIVTGLEEGKTYTLTEKTAPYGYEVTESITFTVTTDKDTQIIEMKDMPILKNIKIQKVDAETKEAIKDKFTFAIYEDQECTKLIKEVKSDKAEGTALFEELRYGTYFIKEIKAPKGYELSDRVVKVEINDKGIFIDDEISEETDSTVTINFENKKIEVPQTGDSTHIILALGILLLATLGLSYLGIKTYKNRKNK